MFRTIEIKLKQNWNKTVLKQFLNRFISVSFKFCFSFISIARTTLDTCSVLDICWHAICNRPNAKIEKVESQWKVPELRGTIFIRGAPCENCLSYFTKKSSHYYAHLQQLTAVVQTTRQTTTSRRISQSRLHTLSQQRLRSDKHNAGTFAKHTSQSYIVKVTAAL